MGTLKDVLDKNKRSSQRWINQLDPRKRKEIDQLIKDFHAGKCEGHSTVTIAKTINEYFKLKMHNKTIGDYVRECRPS